LCLDNCRVDAAWHRCSSNCMLEAQRLRHKGTAVRSVWDTSMLLGTLLVCCDMLVAYSDDHL
jgi:hypothetical protein